MAHAHEYNPIEAKFGKAEIVPEEVAIAAPQSGLDGPVDADDLMSIDGALSRLKQAKKALLRASTAVVMVEPHHDYHSYACGRDYVVNGARADDAHALMGLRSVSLDRYCALLHEAAMGRSGAELYIAKLELMVVNRYRDQLDARGRYVGWRRRWATYADVHAKWEAEPPEHRKHGHWRTRAMTSGQRELIADTVRLTEVRMPGDCDRGQAHDWLAMHGANVVYREVF